MKTKKDKYNLSQQSSSKKAGVEAFQHEKNKGFYFHINDSKGNAILYSQLYTSSKGRNNGIQSVLKNKNEEKRYKVISTKQGTYHFILKAGNNQEIARSRNFKTLVELEKQLAYLQKTTFTYQPDVKTPPVKNTTTRKSVKKDNIKVFNTVVKAKSPSLPKETSLKHAFHIDFYQDENGVFGAGKIKHLLSQDKVALKGLDFAQIQEFIELYTGKAIVVDTKKSLIKEKIAPKIKEEVSPLSEPLVNQTFVTLTNEVGHKKQVQASDMFTINMKLTEELQSDKPLVYSLECSAISLSTGKSIGLGTKQAMLEKDDGMLYFPIVSNTLMPGIYRIESTLIPELKETKSLEPLASNCIIRVC